MTELPTGCRQSGSEGRGECGRSLVQILNELCINYLMFYSEEKQK